MKLKIDLVDKIRALSKDVGGVFTSDDLKLILQPKHNNAYVLKIRKLLEAKILYRFIKGIYVADTFNLAILSQRIEPNSYISLDSVLSKHAVIGILPKNQIKAVKIGKHKVYDNTLAKVVHHGISESLFFGYYTEKGINWAYPEKAWLDTLYFYQKGEKYAFDIYSDVNMNSLSKKRIKNYLKHYKNPKFIAFAEGLL